MAKPKAVPATPGVRTEKFKFDKVRTLKIDFNALCAAEEATGATFAFGMQWSYKNIRALAWAALLHEDPELTQDQVGKWLHADNKDAIADALTRLMETAQPEKEDGGSEDRPTVAAA